LSSSALTVHQSVRDNDRQLVPGTTKLLFAATSFLSAFLLFQVQLIVSKYILPWFGGSAAVWTTSMLVFQMLLLCGYVYSHLVSARLSAVAQTKLHLALLAAVFLLVLTLMFLWPSAITPGTSWKPADSGNPVRDVAVILLVSAGLPFFVLSTTGPLLQRWFARLGVGTKTYKLYSISNLGSLLGLLSFPFLLEPAIGMKTQSLIWSLLFFVFVAGCGLCARKTMHACDETNRVDPAEEIGSGIQTSPLIYSLWFLLPACASALLLATTNMLCQEVTSVPLLWVLPLSIYLLSFILCFDHPRWYQRPVFHPLFIIGVFMACIPPLYGRPILAALPILLFLACMICHGELVRLRPGVERLTAFYLAISAGGAVGGIFVAIVAPHIFTFFTEFPLAVGASMVLTIVCLYRDPTSWIYEPNLWLPAGISAGAILFAYGAGRWWPELSKILEVMRFYPVAGLIGFLVVVGAFAFRSRRDTTKRQFRFVQLLVFAVGGVAILALVRSTQPLPGLYLSARNFYGAIRVFDVPHGKMLMHGRTVHGGQFEPPVDKEPTTYYGRQSGIGMVMQNHPKRNVGDGSLRVGIVGLGAGTLAAYGRPGDYFRYYEINPAVIDLSSGPHPVFTYIQDSAAHVDTVLGDARRLLEQETARGENRKFDVLVVDAFSGDAIPVHLLTREAFETYWQHVDPNGIIAVHVSSGHVNLLPVVQGEAAYFQADSVIRYEDGQGPFLSNCWVLLARRPGVLNTLGLEQRFPPDTPPLQPRLWTDDYSDLFRLIK
jgi:hypothetical protein